MSFLFILTKVCHNFRQKSWKMFGGGGFTASNNVFASKQQTQNNINTGY